MSTWKRRLAENWLSVLLVFVPIVFWLEHVAHASGHWIFLASAVAIVPLDGETHWMEGVQLLAVYVILGIAFYFLPA